jgi:hypothetical protein
MAKPLIAIVGSVDGRRKYDPPIKNTERARQTAELLGAELAKQGFRINVYSAEPDFVECDVVRGYAKSGKALRESIVAHFPEDYEGRFEESKGNEELFAIWHDNSNEWEMSYYRQLASVDGVLLIGGARSTLITGVLARTNRLPLLALKHFGGAAERIWKSLDEKRDLASQQDINTMAKPPDAETAKYWVQSFNNQLDARAKEQRRRWFSVPALIALLLVAAWNGLIATGIWLSGADFDKERHIAFIFLLFLAPLVSGASGATLRMLSPDSVEEITMQSVAFGVGAAGIAAVLYLAAQVTSNFIASPNVLLWAIAYGFIAGLTSDVVMSKLRKRKLLDKIIGSD